MSIACRGSGAIWGSNLGTFEVLLAKKPPFWGQCIFIGIGQNKRMYGGHCQNDCGHWTQADYYRELANTIGHTMKRGVHLF